jgi:hypothetical protein
MVEILNQTFDKSDKTLETAKDNLKDCIAFLLGCCSTNRGELFDELDYRDDETTEGDRTERVCHTTTKRGERCMTWDSSWSVIPKLT